MATIAASPPWQHERPNNSRILVLQFGGLGDLVLISELIGSLKSSQPQWMVTFACRSEFAAVAELFPVAPDQVIGLELNPYLAEDPSEELRRSLESVKQKFESFQADIIIDGALRPTWLSWFLVALVQPASSFCCAGAREPEVMLSIVRGWFGLPRRELIDLGPPPEIQERERYGLLLDYLGVPRVPAFPWRPPKGAEIEARDWLRSHGLREGGFVVCFPNGTAAVKRWPAANFIRTIDAVQSQGFRVLLLGDSAEKPKLTAIANQLERGPAPVFCGDPAELTLAASVLSMAAAYLGNDTGPTHLAQAYGVPGVAIFAGGVPWPRYAPWAAGSIGLIHPLPCFGCNWDCFLGRGLCVESISVEAVTTAVLRALKESSNEPENVFLADLDPAIFPVLADASAQYRSAQADRARRKEVIIELVDANQRLRTIADERLELIESLHAIADERLALIKSLHAEAASRQFLPDKIDDQGTGA
jgi:ADP-heptose:LPS heptosyltransferase